MWVHLLSVVGFFIWNISVTDGLPDCCNIERTDDALQVMCLQCHLQAIPLDVPKKTTFLDLSWNNVKSLLRESFNNLPFLEHLTLTRNKLSLIWSGAFDHLVNLKHLDLSYNLLDVSSFKGSVFQPLNNLRIFSINDNKFYLKNTFPETIFRSLPQIESLSIGLFDGFIFGKEFLNLTNLKTLKFHQDSKLSIRNTSFKGLEIMNISDLTFFVKTKVLESNALYPFQNLSSLYLNSRRYNDIRSVLPIIYGLRGRTMETIRLSYNYARNAGTVRLGKWDIRFLSTVCVRKLILSDNAIESISIAAVLSWTSRGCIKYLDLSGNSLHSPQVFFILKLFPSIQHFDCSFKRSVFLRKRSNIFDQRVYLPNSLVYLNFTHSQLTIFGYVNFVENNNLKVLDISYQQPSLECGGRMKGLEHLTEFDISGIDCSTPHPEMFTEMLMLSKLRARESQLGNSRTFHTRSLFKGLDSLSYVDLSSNQIANLNSNTFIDQTESLKTIVLADNIMERLPFQILKQLNVLEMFDIRNNRISSLTYSEYTLLHNYQSKSDNFTVKLAGNPLVCDCESLDFISWIGTTQAIYDKDQLVCVHNNMKIVKLLESFHEFRIHCVSQFWLTVSTSLAVIVLVFGIVLRLAWRYSVRLRSLCRQPVEHDTYPYDIFVSYCREDCRWIRECLATWLEGHDIEYSAEDKTFDTGLDLCDNIMGAIDDSYQTVFVVSCKFLEYEWQTFAMKLASRYSFREGRENMNIIILLDDMKQSEFPKLIRDIWDKIRPLQWPNEHNTDKTRLGTARKLFWEKLLKRIRKGNKRLVACSLVESTV
ncbi:toll-like receptor 4 [Mizuhopecten yessoensis]|uniref:toll-like receptor 4 n=1 Tax=Mizuhopecten yessoensis TaxID=6573 RepID=UPI000B45BD43|nr:toll-like receptor 4 [Mizuhopecten yessoensis]